MGDVMDEQLESVLDELKGNADEFVFRRIKHIGFSKVIFFLCVRARKEDFIYAKDLAEFRGISRQGASYILGDLVNVGLLKKVNRVENMAEFWIKRDDYGKPLLNKYFNCACKTLKIKQEIVVEK